MSTFDESFPALVTALTERYGRPAGLAPAEPFLAVAAAVLAGDERPARVIAARIALGDAGVLDPEDLAKTDPVDVAEVFGQSALPLPRKAIGTLQRLAHWLTAHQPRDTEAHDTESLRQELAAINGIGRTTADALLLHALRRPVYPLDRATYRIFVRHAWLDPSAEYDEARAVVERPLGEDPEGLARFQALMEQVGREFCRAGKPRCERCPLRPWLPESGPVEPDG